MQNNRNEILISVYQNKKINQVLNNIYPLQRREDTKQDLFYILSSLPEKMFMSVHNKKNKEGESGLIWWSINRLYKITNSNKGTFSKLHRW